MKTIQFQVDNKYIDIVLNLLNSLNGLKLNVINDLSINNNIVDRDSNQQKSKSLRGVFQSYADSDKQSLEDNAWRNYVLEKYKSKMND